GFQMAAILSERGLTQRALDLAYELRRRYFDEGEAHMKYVGLFFGRGREIDPFLSSDVVAANFAVRVQEDGESNWYVIDDRLDASAARNELHTDKDLAKKLLGKKVNDTVVTKGGISETTLTVAEIKSKYVYALHESLQLLPQRFAEVEGLQKVSL